MNLHALRILRAHAERADVAARRAPGARIAVDRHEPHGSEESKSMCNVGPQSELDQVIDAVVRAFPLDNIELADEFFPAHLPVVLMDAIFPARLGQGELPVAISERYCRHFGIARTRTDRWNPPPAREQESLGDLIRRYDEYGPDAIDSKVFGIRRRRPEQGVTKTTNVLRAATVLRNIGIDVLQDVSAHHADEIHDALLSLPGFGDCTARTVLMYSGSDDFVRGDVRVRRFVARAIGRKPISAAEAEALVREAAHEMIVSPRFLDREIWRYGASR